MVNISEITTNNQCFLLPRVKHPKGCDPQASPLQDSPSSAGRVLRPAYTESPEPGMNTSRGPQRAEKNVGSWLVVHPPRAPKKTARHVATSIQSTNAALFADMYRRTEYQTAFGPKKNQCFLPQIPTIRRYPQASAFQDSPFMASPNTLPGKRVALLEQIKVQVINASGNAKAALYANAARLHTLRAPAPPTVPKRGRVAASPRGKGEELLEQIEVEMNNAYGNAQAALSANWARLHTLRAPAPPTVPKRGRVLRPAYTESPEPDMNTSRGPQRAEKNVGSWLVVHPPRAPKKTPRHVATSIQSTNAALFADTYRRTEYQTAFGPKLRTRHFNLTMYRQLHGKAY